jgi:hypothetical protein
LVSGSLDIALVGQTFWQGAFLHCSQITGTAKHMLSFFGTHSRATFMSSFCSFRREQATTHDLQPVQASKSKNSMGFSILNRLFGLEEVINAAYDINLI